jgi:hypothetical protein
MKQDYAIIYEQHILFWVAAQIYRFLFALLKVVLNEHTLYCYFFSSLCFLLLSLNEAHLFHRFFT